MPETQIGESKDGTGSGDHDTPYSWGHPRECLTIRAQARLTIMRGYVMDTRAGAHGLAADGDLDWVSPGPAGLVIPTPPVTGNS